MQSFRVGHRIYDINIGRWTTPDPVASPCFNLFGSKLCPTATVDASGLEEITVRIGQRYGVSEKQLDDSQDERVAEYVGTNNISRSCEDFMKILQREFDAARLKDPKACIKNLEFYGHCGTGYGGRCMNLSEDQISKTQEMLCEGATITNQHCLGGYCSPGSVGEENWNILKLLTKKGGKYIGWTGNTYWKNLPGGGMSGPFGHDGDKKEYDVKKGDTAEDFKKRYPDTAKPQEVEGEKNKKKGERTTVLKWLWRKVFGD